MNSIVRIWRLDTGESVAGPFKFDDYSPSIMLRLSEDTISRKLAVISSNVRRTVLQVCDVQAQKLDVQISTSNAGDISPLPDSWTTKDKSIVAAFSFTDDYPAMIYEFDASILKTVGTPFKGHTRTVTSLALSPDCVLLASSSDDNTIKLWAFESRQLLTSFNVKFPKILILSPDSRQMAYATWDDTNIYICNILVNILASIGLADEVQHSTSKSKHSPHAGLLNSDATPHPARRKPVIITVTPISRPLPTRDLHVFLHFFRKFLPSSSRADTVRSDGPRNPLDFPVTSPLPRPLPNRDGNSRSTPVPPTTQSTVTSTSPILTGISRLHRPSTWWPFQTHHVSLASVDVPLAPAKLRYAAAGAPSNDDGLIRDEDYVPPSCNAGQHGSDRFCFCF
ncbi:hypothetical protein BDR04DRAFT_293375 [Suillus decipiens]|nr:hypothetical protein BDR04DRAFT_293375 [Suillus decipiens]